VTVALITRPAFWDLHGLRAGPRGGYTALWLKAMEEQRQDETFDRTNIDRTNIDSTNIDGEKDADNSYRAAAGIALRFGSATHVDLIGGS